MLVDWCGWFVFFFSSRRRHTRFDCDWSSDVCSSDLGFAISVRMSEALREAILEVPEKEWKAYGEPEPGIDRECAEVVFVSNQQAEPKNSQPLRYIAIRLRQRQGGVVAHRSSGRQFGVLRY